VSGSWRRWAETELSAIRQARRWRAPRDLDARGPEGVLEDGRRVVSFASNDYLGFTHHPAVIDAALDAVRKWGTGAGSARLIVGSRTIHSELERSITEWKGTEATALFPTGFMANLGVLSTFGRPGVRILSDELNHASIVDGCRLARADVAIYRHGDLDHVASHLDGAEEAIVATDTVFSMDGDLAPLDGLADLCARHDALLVLDEAHAVLGPEPHLEGVDHLRVGTLSKTLGSLGGFVTGPRSLVELVVNRARSYIFTTAPAPADAGAALAALRVLMAPEGHRLVQRLRSLVERIAPGHPSPIIPIVLGSEERALAAADSLLERGLLVPAIRPPTVPEGSSRLRVSLSAAHTDEHIDRLGDAVAALGIHARAPA